MNFDYHAPGIAKIKAFGLKRYHSNASREQKHLLAGEEVVISMPDGDVLYEISRIRYYSDPYDLYEAEIRYIQHLTGLKTVAQSDARQRARSREWSQQKRE